MKLRNRSLIGLALFVLLTAVACDGPDSVRPAQPRLAPGEVFYGLLHHNIALSRSCAAERVRELQRNEKQIVSLVNKLALVTPPIQPIRPSKGVQTFFKSDKRERALTEILSLVRSLSGPEYKKLIEEVVALRSRMLSQDAQLIWPFFKRALTEKKVRTFFFQLGRIAQEQGMSPGKESAAVWMCLTNWMGNPTGTLCNWVMTGYYGLDSELTAELLTLGEELVSNGLYADATALRTHFNSILESDLLARVNNLLAIIDIDPNAALASASLDPEAIDGFWAILAGVLPEAGTARTQLQAKNYAELLETAAEIGQKPEAQVLLSELTQFSQLAFSLFSMTDESRCQSKPFLGWEAGDFEKSLARMTAFLEDDGVGLKAHLQLIRVVLASQK